MSKEGAVYDLHITVNPHTFDDSFVLDPKLGLSSWKILSIHNTQGDPHLIISRKQVEPNLSGRRIHHTYLGQLEAAVDSLKLLGVFIQRKKVEFHFRNPSDLLVLPESARKGLNGIVEIHYKYRRKGLFDVTKEQIEELNRKKLALSFNKRSNRVIVSARFNNLAAYLRGSAPDALPQFLEDEEREIVVSDSENKLDDFWPMRIATAEPLRFEDFPTWIPR